MAAKEPKLTVEIPRPGDERPAWSRVGIVGAAGFVVGVLWPRLLGVTVGPNAPNDARPADSGIVATAGADAGPAPALPSPSASASAAAAAPENQQLVVVAPGKLTKCSDKKDKKVDDCGKLDFDPVALPRLKELARCPSALGLEGKLSLALEVDFQKKEVRVARGKKSTLPNSTVQGVLGCAAHELGNVGLEEVQHGYRKYTVVYALSFYPPGKHPDDPKSDKAEDADAGPAAPSDGDAANGSGTVSWDTALVRKEPKDGDIVARLVRGTKVKLLGRQNDWYKIETGSKTGWIYRGAIGL
jgi:hypothetical protein